MHSRTLRHIVLLLSCASAPWSHADASTSEQSSAIPQTFCVSERAPNGRVYLTPVFEDPLRDVRGAFAGYLADTYRYGGKVECFTLPTRELADQFRTQRIAIAHWLRIPHVVATQWVPQPGVSTPRSEVAEREADSASGQSG